MRVVYGLDNIGAELGGGVLSIGNFDGVHLGHQLILRRGAQSARKASGPLIAMTFDPHPLAILRPDRVPPILTPMTEKLAQLSNAGADTTVIVRTDHDFLSLTADEFVRRVIVARCRAVGIVEGPSFTYGRARQGNVDTLRAAGTQYGFAVHIVEPMEIETETGRREMISSSLVRRAVSTGHMELAAQALGRPYALIGTVIRGRGRGRELGFPTVNLAPQGQLLPAEGVYAGAAVVADAEYPAAVSIGRAPTFGETEMLVEAYLLDFNGDVYGQMIRLEIKVRLRRQEKFPSVDALRAQMARDVAAVRERQ
jgi:riboflavin kinase/FMN adenylyltransferase